MARLLPVPWVICMAASGQSVATMAFASACTASNSGLATFSERSKYSVLKPQVPSTAEQRSTTVDLACRARRAGRRRTSCRCSARAGDTARGRSPPRSALEPRVERPGGLQPARYSNRSRVCEATSLASSEPSSHAYSCFSM